VELMRQGCKAVLGADFVAQLPKLVTAELDDSTGLNAN
jgi:hypothetical protein